MSRSGSGKSSRKGSAKKKTPKQQIKELTEQNELLTSEVDLLKANQSLLLEKILTVTQKITEGVNKKQFNIKESTDLSQLTTQVILEMISSMIIKKKSYDVSVEARADQLENRVTKMTLQNAKMMRKTAAYEYGLSEVMKYNDIEQVRDRIYQLQLIAGQEYHSFDAHDALERSFTPSTPECNSPQLLNDIIPNNHSTVPQVIISHADVPLSPTEQLANDSAREFNLVKPIKKLPAETHIRNMHSDLKLYVMKEMSVEKQSGADWRMLAARVNIDPKTISYWSSLRLECPMGRVMAEWMQDNSATVHLLHRHLMSPQMRCTIVAKRIADFYDVL